MYDDIDGNEIDARELHALYRKEWWTQKRELDDVARMLDGCELAYGIKEQSSGALVGFARVLTDGVFKALIFDVIVDETHRGRALGDRLMARMLDDPRLAGVAHIELYCRPELEPFYVRHGFSLDNGGVALMRKLTGQRRGRADAQSHLA